MCTRQAKRIRDYMEDSAPLEEDSTGIIIDFNPFSIDFNKFCHFSSRANC